MQVSDLAKSMGQVCDWQHTWACAWFGLDHSECFIMLLFIALLLLSVPAAFPDDWRWPEPRSFHSRGFSHVDVCAILVDFMFSLDRKTFYTREVP
jgi:hypothetical protein